MQPALYHVPVMLNEVLEYLLTTPDGIYVDGTLGGGGHAEKICEQLSAHGMLIGIDADADAISAATDRLQHVKKKNILVHNNTEHIAAILREQHISTIHGLLLDLGVSSFQLDEAVKGFSFRGNEKLDMRMDKRQALDAASVVNSYDEKALADIFFHFGEEKLSRKIARLIVRKRELKPIETTGELAAIVEQSVGGKFAVKSLARVFQAIRIEVNNELERLKSILQDAVNGLTVGGRIVVISYHSLEDRIVKQFFQSQASTRIPSGDKLIPDIALQPALKVLTRKPITATAEEIERNPRARSAKLRAAEKI